MATQGILPCLIVFYKNSIDSWNKLTTEINTIYRKENSSKSEIKDIDLLKFSRNVLKDRIMKHILSTYEE